MGGQTTNKQVSDFLSLFNYNTADAIQAIKSYANDATLTSAPGIKAAQPDGRVIIEARDLAKTYKVARQTISAINGITLNIHEGEFVAITAPSGSGKSTLLQLLGGLEKPTSGSVIINDVDVNKLSDQKLSEFRGQTIGFIFQFFYLQPFLNLERNIEVPGMFARTDQRERHEHAQELAKIVGIADRLQHLPKELSGGQIQRAAIARALLNKPKVILADEPTGNLDTENGRGIIELFKQVRAKFGTTVVVATHDPVIAAQADRVIKLRDGVIV